MNRYLLIFNTCEIKQNNLFLYIKGLECLLYQTQSDFTLDIAISGCALTTATKVGLQKKFGSRLFYNFIDEILTVNVTFNKTVDEIVKRKGRYTGYIYVDSGVITDNPNAIQEMHERIVTGVFGIVTLQTNTDMGLKNWFGLPDNFIWKGQDFIIPIGKCVNLHFNYFDDRIYQYYGKIIPDIFKAYCTESIFSFLVAALGLQWVVVKDVILTHLKSADGATAGFEHIGDKGYWNNLLCGLDMQDILKNPRAKTSGFGYDEWANVFPHDPTKFDQYGKALDTDLKSFIKEFMFLPQHLFNYENIKCKTVV